MRIHYLQHVPFEGLSIIAQWAEKNNYSIQSTKFFQSDYTLPAVDDFDILVVLGGPMSANDTALHPWLAEERACIQSAIDAGKYVLGICLGAQQIAKTLGAEVKANAHEEIGWFPIALTDQALGLSLLSGINTALTVFHWHGETFDIPDGAVPIAISAACANQGFVYKHNVLALQFHIEMNASAVERIVDKCGSELVDGKYIQSKDTILNGANKYHLEQVLFKLLNNWISPAFA